MFFLITGIFNANAQAPAGYTLSTSDEFNSLTLDTTLWKYRVGVAGASYCRPENVVIADGKVKINLKRETYGGKSLTGGGIITKIPRRYGYYEVSVKMNSGQGWHDAFWTSWMSGFDDQNPIYQNMDKLEIDCFERYPDYTNNYFTYGAIEWYPLKGNANRDYQTVSENLTGSYNRFGFEFTPDYLNYYYNGTLLKTVDTRELPKHDLYLWLTSIADETTATDSAAVYFDYLRCYSIDSATYNIRKIPFIAHLDSLRLPTHSDGKDLWVEAENFKNINNWTKELDENMKVIKGFTSRVAGRDSATLTASTGIKVDSAGTYRLWVRSRDVDTAPGTRKFKVIINGQPAIREFGNHGVNGYAWQDGGTFQLSQDTAIIKLFDSSQFFARCDKLLLTTDVNFIPIGIGGNSNVTYVTPGNGNIPFTAGNLAVVRIGDGAAPLVLGNAQKVFLDEYSTTGTFVRSHPLPDTVSGTNKRLTLSVSATDHTEGFLSLSPDGQYLALGGYDAAPGLAAVSASASATVNRIIGLVDAGGVINTSTRLNTFSGVAIRTAVTNNGTDIWTTGGNNGIRYASVGSATSTAVTTLTARCLNIFDNQLYGSSTATGMRVVKVGTGLPKTTGQTLTNLPGIPTASGDPYGIYMADLDASVPGVDVLYVANAGSNVLSKYSLVNDAWVLNGRVGNSADFYWGLTGMHIGAEVVLYATRKNSGSTAGGGEIIKLTDTTGYNGSFSGTPLVLATAAANTLFKGIAFAPGTAMEAASFNQRLLEKESFSGKREGDYIKLTWFAAAKTSNSYFNVYRTTDEKNREFLGRIEAGGLVNNSYHFSDYYPAPGTNNYMLEQLDSDGKARSSAKVTVADQRNKEAFIKVYPTSNPESLTIVVSSMNPLEGPLKIVNITNGKLIYNKYLKVREGKSSFVVRVNNSQSGLYAASYQTNGGMLSYKFLKR